MSNDSSRAKPRFVWTDEKKALLGRALFEHRETRWMLSVHWKEAPAVVEEEVGA